MNNSRNRGILFDIAFKIANRNRRFHRISSMMLDHIIMCLVLLPPVFLVIILSSLGGFVVSENLINACFFFILFFYYNKDYFRAKSPGKRLLGYQVVHHKSGRIANGIRCFIRNFTIALIWPLEVIVAFIHPERRLGDYLAGTRVERSPEEPLGTFKSDLRNTPITYHLLVTLILGLAYGFFYGLMNTYLTTGIL